VRVADDLAPELRAELLAGIMRGEPIRYLALCAALGHAAQVGQGRGAEDGGRQAALFALNAAMHYLSDLPAILPALAPLRALHAALRDLHEHGVVSPMFRPASQGSNRLPSDVAMLHASAAAWSVTLRESGIAPFAADALVAKRLAAMGYRLRGPRQEPPGPGSVAQWRKEAARPARLKASGVDRQIFDRLRRELAPIAKNAGAVNEVMTRTVSTTLAALMQKGEKG
jgi:hypothetical protein